MTGTDGLLAAVDAVHEGRLAEIGAEALHEALIGATVLVPVTRPAAVVLVRNDGMSWVYLQSWEMHQRLNRLEGYEPRSPDQADEDRDDG